MIPATDSAKRFPGRRVWTILALFTLAVETGCARLRSFRQDDRPTFGTETASDGKRRVGRSGSGDLYADRLSRPQDSTRPSLARRSSAPTGEADGGPSPADRDERPVVSLQPPVTLVAAQDNPDTEGASEKPPSDALSSHRSPDPEPESMQTETAPAKGASLEKLLADSRQRLDRLTSYRVKMSHQERVAATLNPAEDVILSVRRNPQAIRLEWPSGPHAGREVLYASDSPGKLMYIHMANSPLPRLSMAPDSPLATRNSRHPITEAGYDTIVRNMELASRKQQAGDLSLGKIRYVGLEKPEGFDNPCHKVVRVTPTKETWVVYVDPQNQLPVLVEATAGNGDLLERYEFRDPTFDLADLASAEAFDPDTRWGKPTGLFQRLARGASASPGEKTVR